MNYLWTTYLYKLRTYTYTYYIIIFTDTDGGHLLFCSGMRVAASDIYLEQKKGNKYL